MYRAGKPLTRQVDLNLLELFDTVYRLRNLTAAGKQLGLSQPAVSYGLGRLRDMYDDTLFVRIQRGVRPTPLADQLATPFAQALQIVRGTLDKTSFDPQRVRHTFRIAMTDIGERLFLPYLWEWLEKEAPNISVETTSPPRDKLAEELATGRTDIAMGFIPGLGNQVHRKALFNEHFVYLLRADHPMASAKTTPGLARKWPHVIAAPPGTEHASTIEKALRQSHYKTRIALRVRSFLGIPPIVASTILIAPVPSNLAKLVARDGNLCIREPASPFTPFEVSLYWHQCYDKDPARAWLRKSIIDLFDGARPFQ